MISFDHEIAFEGRFSGGAVRSTDNEISAAKLISSLIHQQNNVDTSRNHQVTLISFGNRKLEIFNAIALEVMKNCPQNAVVIHFSFSSIKPWLVHASSIVVVVTDIPDPYKVFVSLIKIFNRNYYTNQAKFIFVPPNWPRKVFGLMFGVPDSLGILNAIIVFGDTKVEVLTGNLFRRKWGVAESYNIDALFPDKLKNMHRFNYQVCVYKEPPKIRVHQNEIGGVEVSIMSAIAQMQNAELNITALPLVQQKLLTYEGLR